MATRKPAVSTLLKQAQARIEELEKKVASAEQSKKWSEDRASAAESELADVHAFFDALPNTIPQKDADSYKSRAAMTRLAAWLANRPA
jgi:hypothetical protein